VAEVEGISECLECADFVLENMQTEEKSQELERQVGNNKKIYEHKLSSWRLFNQT
jgi:hypothetical protein